MAVFLGTDRSGNGNHFGSSNFTTSGNGAAANIVSFTAVGTTTWVAPANVSSVS